MKTYKEFLENGGEKKWQAIWEERELFKTPADATSENKMYILPQLPYPSGSGLHVGHAEVYTACDIYSRYQRMKGKKVLQVFGLDSFGLPAENYAIKTGVHPKQTIDQTGENFVSQVKDLGISVDWDRFVRTSDADYYKWTQWFFLLMYKRGLAYRKKQAVNWCESCKTVLANEQVVEGNCERCDTTVEQKQMEQWYLRITEYADRLLEGLENIDWPEETKKRQADWIGRSEGAEIDFAIFGSEQKIKVFTTRQDTLFGATYMVLAPEHGLVQELKEKIENFEEVQKYIDKTKKKTDLERQIEQEKTGIELKGLKAINPVNGEEIPVWIADYVLMGYGTGAIMAVPAHDDRDYEFASKFGIEIREVVAKRFGEPVEGAEHRDCVFGVVVRNEKILVLYDKENNEYRLPGGGYDGEDEIKALERELIEESGYTDFEIGDCLGTINSHFYAVLKKVQRSKFSRAYVINVKSDNQQQVSDEDAVYEIKWLEPEKAFSALEGNKEDAGEYEFVKRYIEKSNFHNDNGVMINSDFLNELTVSEAKEKALDWLEEKKLGNRKVQYKLRDWSVSRQRFWGAPIPMLYDEKGELQPVLEGDLPVILPDDVDFKPTGESPLNYSKSFNDGVEEKYGKGWKREPDTLDTFMCSSWYFFRYLDPKNETEFASPEALKKWMPVDFYLGGPEHVNGHLLYARFFTKVLFDAGYIDFDEPFKVNRHQGLILGEDGRKMSKRWNNVVNPSDVVSEFGADTCRMYEMFMGPLEDDKPWNMNGVKGISRFLERVWRLQEKVQDSVSDENLEKLVNKTIKKVGEDLSALGFNTAIAKLMELSNAFGKAESISKENFKVFIKMLSPFAPHVSEELWSDLGHESSLILETWPKYDESKIIEEKLTLAVQVNGKVRANIEIDAEENEEKIKELALNQENVQKWLEGKEPKKVIYVKGRLVSVVV